MKFRRLFKKAAAALMAAVTALSVLPATTAFAAGDIGTISFTHTYDSRAYGADPLCGLLRKAILRTEVV